MVSRIRRRSAVGAFFGFVALSTVAGLLVAVAITPGVVLAGQATSAAVATFESIPEFLEIQKLQERNVLYATSHGKQVPFATLYSENRVTVGAKQVSQNLKDAAVAGEDHGFFQHGGVSVSALGRAALGTLVGGSLGSSGGGSTLTMQLVRNVLIAKAEALDDPAARKAAYRKATEVSSARKIAEMKYAIGLEKRYSKDEILLAYLNIAYFGDNAYGVEAAAQHYFGTSAASLGPAKAASLIAMVQYPEKRNLSSPSGYAANKARRDVILEAMHRYGKISAAQLKKSKATTIRSTVRLTPATQGCTAVTAVGAQQWCDLIRRMVKTSPSLGSSTAEREKNWRLGGYAVHTTLDLDLTETAKRQLETYAPKTETRYDLGGAAVSVEVATGRVVVLTQNKDFDDTRDGGGPTASAVNYAVDQKWGSSTGFQPGSTYKPFTLIDWLAKGHLLGESIDATPRDFSPNSVCGAADYTTFAPKNDDFGNPGVVTTRQATARSINTAFAAMAQKLDLCDIRDVAVSLGVHAADGGDLNAYPSSTIGAGNTIAPLTMASAFTAIAHDGIRCQPVFIDSIVESGGRKLPGDPRSCTQAIDSGVAAKAASAMQGVFAGGTATAARTPDGIPLFGKTGTTDHAEQTWLVGGSTEVVTASWVGNISGHQNQYLISGEHGPMNQQRLYVWRELQTAVDAVYGGHAFTAPAAEYIAPPPSAHAADADADTDADDGSSKKSGDTDGGSGASAAPEGDSPAPGDGPAGE